MSYQKFLKPRVGGIGGKVNIVIHGALVPVVTHTGEKSTFYVPVVPGDMDIHEAQIPVILGN